MFLSDTPPLYAYFNMQLKKPFARATVLVSLCFLGYLNSLHGDLVHDDIFAIKENEDVKGGTPISSIFGNDFWGKSMSDPTSHKSYRPLTVLSFRMNHVVHGLDPLGYHIVNVSLHTVCTILVWVTSSVLVFKNGSTSGLSFLAATIFAVHPIHTEAVSAHDPHINANKRLSIVFLLLPGGQGMYIGHIVM